MGWITDARAVAKHSCAVPEGIALPQLEELPAFWKCDECHALWKVELSQGWGGFWSADHAPEGVEVAQETFHVHSPQLKFTHYQGGLVGVDYSFTRHVGYPHLPDSDNVQALEGRTRLLPAPVRWVSVGSSEPRRRGFLSRADK